MLFLLLLLNLFDNCSYYYFEDQDFTYKTDDHLIKYDSF